MKTSLRNLTLAFLPIMASCSVWPEPDHASISSGAYGRKQDELHMANARRFLAAGNSVKARVELAALSENAQSASMHLLVAESFFREGNAHTANDEIALAADLEPNNPAVDMLRGMVSESVGDWGAASQAYLLASSKDRGDLDPVLACARAMHAMGDPIRAATYLETEVGSRPVNIELSMAAGNAYLSIGSYLDGVTHFSSAMEVDPDNFEAREGLVLSLSLSGAHREALSRTGNFSADAWSSTLQLAIGRSALLIGEVQSSASFLSTFLLDFDTDPTVWLDLSRAYYLDKRFNLAMKAVGRSLDLNRHDPAAYTLLGHIRLRNGQNELAFAAYERAILSGGDAILLTELMDRARRQKASREDGEL